MTPAFRIAALSGLAVLVSACAKVGPHPVVARDPVPPPSPGYRVVCEPGVRLLNDIVRNCREARPPVRRTTVVRSRG